MKTVLRAVLYFICASSAQNIALANISGPDDMYLMYERIKNTLDNPTPEIPFYLKAESKDDIESGEAALYIPLTLDELSDALGSVSNWCDILPLHINVKACTYNATGNGMTLYMGRKFYQEPDDAFELEYTFTAVKADDYFSAIAVAEEGPLKTKNYRIELEFITIEGKTFGRIFVSNHLSWLSEKAMEVYLSTLGKDKQGITVIGHDELGNPVYSSGGVAVAERNLVRYYLAFMSFFDNAEETDSELRYEKQLNNWFDRTEKFPQLYELSKQEYLSGKRKERENQLKLQE
jgi:hypothetical protein